MPDPFARQGEPMDDRPRILSLWSDGSWRADPACRRLFVLLLLLVSAFWPASLNAQRAESSDVGDHRFDIGIIIDNRPLPRSDAAVADVNTLLGMVDRQMFIEHIMVFEHPTIEVMCDVFGCPEAIEDLNPFPPLIWQITREKEARLFVYYIGDGRVEGLERQLLFRRVDGSRRGDVVAFPAEWLHDTLDDASPSSAVLMLDTSFSPRPLPCADEDPLLISDALLSVRRNYRNVMRAHWNRTDNLELSATTPVQPPHCDRFDQALDDVEQPLFTKFLLKAIVEGEADREPFGDDDRLIDLGELTDYLDDRIRHAARFQWGRLQNVRSVGARSKVLATLDGRELSPENEDVLARRNGMSKRDDTQEPEIAPSVEGPGPEGGGQAEIGAKDREAACRDDPTADGCHPCVIDPDGKACAERCQEDADADLCAPNLASTTERDAVTGTAFPAIATGKADVITPKHETDRRIEDEIDAPSAVCSWIIDNVSPYAATLVQRIRGSTQSSCEWATDRSEVELGPFAKIFTPIGWRLGRGTTQDAVSCLLDCGRTVLVEESMPVDLPAPALQTGIPQAPQIPVDPRSLSAFNREICDELEEPLPPYIGLPRWMPGTLIISEALRAGHGCPPPPAEPFLPTPLAVAIEAPEGLDAPAPAVASADQKLSRWPPATVGVDPLPLETDREPSDIQPGARIADSTPTSTDRPTEEQEDLPDETLSIEKEFDRTVGKVRWLQSALTVDNRHPGPIDGVIGTKTEAAIRSWRQDNRRKNRTGPLTEPEFRMIIEKFGERFGQIEEPARSF